MPAIFFGRMCVKSRSNRRRWLNRGETENAAARQKWRAQKSREGKIFYFRRGFKRFGAHTPIAAAHARSGVHERTR
jgi:hypothetical protein